LHRYKKINKFIFSFRFLSINSHIYVPNPKIGVFSKWHTLSNVEYRALWIKVPRRRFLVGISVIPLPKIDGGGLTEPPFGLLCLLVLRHPIAPSLLHEKKIILLLDRFSS